MNYKKKKNNKNMFISRTEINYYSDTIIRIRIRICLFSYTQKKIQYEKYKLKCYIMKKESLSIIVSYINAVVNQTDAYKI